MTHPDPRRSPAVRRRPAIRLVPAVAALFLFAACSPAGGDLGGVATPPPTSEPSLQVPSSEPTPGPSRAPGSPEPSGLPPSGPPTSGTIVRAYFFLGSFTTTAGLAPVLREVPETVAVGAAAMNALLAGPNEAELSASPAMYTAVPNGSRFLGLRIEGGIAIVNLSREFESGGGSASVLGRLAQVVYTLTQFPTVEGVQFELDGTPITVFSGEGVMLDKPLTRADYTDQLPPIWVDRPAWGGVLGNPARVTGLANVFEAAFQVAILDGSGKTLTDEHVMASCGTGCWGTFDVTLPYANGTAQWGTLRVYDFSARDGSPENVRDYPVWLIPGGP
ncbi:MAG: Gmad2 immunoglobulin-like domain-containing protein [Chloroflexota bacterium]